MARIVRGASTNVATPLLADLCDTLVRSGCEVLHVDGSPKGTFSLSWEDPLLQRAGLRGQLVPLVRRDRNPGGADATLKLAGTSATEPDPFGLFTSVLLGIDPSRDLFVAFDPARHFPEDEPLRVSISAAPLRRVLARGWHAWEREEYERDGTGFAETLVGFTAPNLVRYVLFERLASGLDTGHRQLLAERFYSDVLRGRG
jgi:hypothetical protein